MKVFLIVVLFFSGLLLRVGAQMIVIGDTGMEYGKAIVEMGDGGFAIAGHTNSHGHGGYDIYVVKIDKYGNIEWTRTIGTSANEYGHSMIRDSRGNLVVSGFRVSSQNAEDIYVVKLSANGDVVWVRSLGGNNGEWGDLLAETHDGNYIVGGATHSWNAQMDDIYLIKVDTAGMPLWAKIIGGMHADDGHSIRRTSDGGFVIGGFTSSYGQTPGSSTDLYIVKIDSVGNIEWGRTIGGPASEYGYSAIQTRDGGYVIAGKTFSYGQGGGFSDMYIAKLRSDGSLAWTRTIGGPYNDLAHSVMETSDGFYVVVGETQSFSSHPGMDGDAYIVKLDTAGNIIWSRVVGGHHHDHLHSVIEASNGKYVAIGHTESFGHGMADILVLMIDTNGDINTGSCGIVQNNLGYVSTGGVLDSGGVVLNVGVNISSEGDIDTGGSVYVCSPFDGVIKYETGTGGIIYRITADGGVEFYCPDNFENPMYEIYDIMGRKLEHNIAQKGQWNKVETVLSEGIYMLFISSDRERRYGRFVVHH